MCFTGFSLDRYMKINDLQHLTEIGISGLFQDLGISAYLISPQCVNTESQHKDGRSSVGWINGLFYRLNDHL